MKINRLSWDSDFFGKEIGEITLSANDEQVFETENFDLIVVKQQEPFPVSIPNYKQIFEETKVIFEKELTENTVDLPEIKDTDASPKDWEFFKELAYESGKHSRFLLDENFGRENFEKLYDEWVINSLNKKFAVKTFYIEENNVAVGFATIQKAGNIGKIGLIATSPKYQGKGFGKKLLQYAENYCLNNGMKIMEIPTQKENLQACAFYIKLGYHIKNELIIKHLWKEF